MPADWWDRVVFTDEKTFGNLLFFMLRTYIRLYKLCGSLVKFLATMLKIDGSNLYEGITFYFPGIFCLLLF